MDEEKSTYSSVEGVVKKCLHVLSEAASPSLPTAVCKGLLATGTSTTSSSSLLSDRPTAASLNNCTLQGYPTYPLYQRLSLSISQWMTTGKCPVLELPNMYLLNEAGNEEEKLTRIQTVGHSLSEAAIHWEEWIEDTKQSFILNLLEKLGVRGVLDLLGVRETVGSCCSDDCLPPSRAVLMTTFTSSHSANSKLTVGARALSKHCHRDTSLQWWGSCTGSEEDKNRHAVERVETVLREAVWINIHILPHDVKVIEVRIMEGYGARWSRDGSEFRGFVEPQMIDGHQHGWKH